MTTTPTTQREADERQILLVPQHANGAYMFGAANTDREWFATDEELKVAGIRLVEFVPRAAIDESAPQAASQQARMDYDSDALYAAWHKVGADVAGLRFCDFIVALEAAPQAATTASAICTVLPSGWVCTRSAGHDGPCAALPAPVCATCGCAPCGCIARAPAPSREDFDRLLGQYWEIAYDEGRTVESRGTEAQVVLTKLRAALARAPLPTPNEREDK